MREPRNGLHTNLVLQSVSETSAKKQVLIIFLPLAVASHRIQVLQRTSGPGDRREDAASRLQGGRSSCLSWRRGGGGALERARVSFYARLVSLKTDTLHVRETRNGLHAKFSAAIGQ